MSRANAAEIGSFFQLREKYVAGAQRAQRARSVNDMMNKWKNCSKNLFVIPSSVQSERKIYLKIWFRPSILKGLYGTKFIYLTNLETHMFNIIVQLPGVSFKEELSMDVLKEASIHGVNLYEEHQRCQVSIQNSVSRNSAELYSNCTELYGITGLAIARK